MTATGLLRSLVRAHRGELAGGAALAGCHQAAEACVPVLIGVVVDQAIAREDAGRLWLWLGVLCGLFVVLALAGLWGWHLVDRAHMRMAHDVRLLLAERALDPRGGLEQVARTGELVALGSGDATRSAYAALAVAEAAAGAAGVSVAAVVLLVGSPALGALVLLGVPTVVLVSQQLVGPLRARAETEQAAAAEATATATDLVSGLRVLTGLGAQAAAARRFRASSRSVLGRRLVAARALGAYEAVTLAIGGVFLVLVAWVGARMAYAGTISVGELVAAVGLAQYLVEPLASLTESAGTWATARASAERVARVLDSEPALAGEGTAQPEASGGELAFAGLRFPTGRFAGLLVDDPAAARTLVDGLGRHVEPEAPILLGGRDLREFELGAVRRVLHVAEHDPWLPSGSLGELLSGASAAVLAATAADEVLAAVPGGAAAEVGEGGRRLSGGQRQRVALARAVALDPAVLVLQAPTSAVDAVTEARIARGLRDLRKGRTTIVIDPSPAMRAIADEVLTMTRMEVAR